MNGVNGADADARAAMQADRMSEGGDLEGAAVWRGLSAACASDNAGPQCPIRVGPTMPTARGAEA